MSMSIATACHKTVGAHCHSALFFRACQSKTGVDPKINEFLATRALVVQEFFNLFFALLVRLGSFAWKRGAMRANLGISFGTTHTAERCEAQVALVVYCVVA
jgi:hypothetical protein